MSDDVRNTVEDYRPVIEWAESPTIFADAVIGFSITQDAARITLGTLSFVPNGLPVLKPSVTIAASGEGWNNILNALNTALNGSRLAALQVPDE